MLGVMFIAFLNNVGTHHMACNAVQNGSPVWIRYAQIVRIIAPVSITRISELQTCRMQTTLIRELQRNDEKSRMYNCSRIQ